MENETETVISLVPHEVCKLFGEESMSVELFLTRLNELSDSVESDEIKIQKLKDDISYEIISNDIILSSIRDKKYQLSVSQNLLKQIQTDIKKLESQKQSILKGNFDGQITLKMAQSNGFIYLQKDDQHALEFLASELRFPLLNILKFSKLKNSESSSNSGQNFFDINDYIEPGSNNYQYTNSMRIEIMNLFNESVKYFKGMNSIFKEQTKLNASVNEKVSWIKKEIKSKQEDRTNLQIELNQLKFEINKFHQNRKVIKVRPDRFEQQEKGQKIIDSKKKEFYRFNRILNEFKSFQCIENKKHSKSDSSFNSFELEMHCFDESSHFDEDLEKLTRKIRRNILDLSNELVSHRNDLLNKSEKKEKFLTSNISSIENILSEIENSNDKIVEKTSKPIPESILELKRNV